jgi:Flp pilus assembly pilin Flp
MLRLAVWSQNVRRQFRDERGANLAEYGILVVLIAVLAIAAITVVGDQTMSNVSGVSSAL